PSLPTDEPSSVSAATVVGEMVEEVDHTRPLFLFFFSSRRRHTRSLRDWSSDVCSSDLDRLTNIAHAAFVKRSPMVRVLSCSMTRSEERRVGKECRSRGSPYR